VIKPESRSLSGRSNTRQALAAAVVLSSSSERRDIRSRMSGISLNLVLGQMILGVVNGVFYALLSLGVAIIFGLLGIINFAHGVFFTMGAFIGWMLLNYFGIDYWLALIVVPIIVGLVGMLVEVFLVRFLYQLDHLYGLLLTIGFAMAVEGAIRMIFGAQGLPYNVPPALRGAYNFGFMLLPVYRAWVVIVGIVTCCLTWFLVERTPLGAKLRAATENPQLVQAFGVNVPLVRTVTYGAGVALAAFGGVLAAPIYSVDPFMGSNMVIVVFAVVVIGGMGSILGSVVTGFALGMVEGFAKAVFPEVSSSVIFVIMAIVLLVRPGGLFGRAA
jgi:branched-chain amino acid transport system permease protein